MKLKIDLLKILFKHILVFAFLLIGFQIKAEAEVDVPTDSIEAWDNSFVDYRHASADTIAYYKQLPEYDYNEVKQTESLLDKFLKWLASLLFSGNGASWTGWILIVLAVFALLAIIIRLFGIPIKGLFVFSRSTKVTELNFSTGSGDLENENLDKLLKGFIDGQAYREATRTLFLMTLRQLNRNQLIKWSIWKTDREYYYELKDEKLKAEFLKAIRQYEYIWYGKFTPEKEYFEKVRLQFSELKQSIAAVKN